MESIRPQDRELLHAKGISENKLEAYRQDLLRGFPPVKISANALVDRGIHRFSKKDRNYFQMEYHNRKGVDVIKFVPASGAASRMFKDLFAYLNGSEPSKKTREFFRDLEKYPFCDRLIQEAGISAEAARDETLHRRLLKTLLTSDGLNYGNLPKGSVLFHKYSNGPARTAFEEHFHEGAMYASNGSSVRIHFTIPAEGRQATDNLLAEAAHRTDDIFGVRFNATSDVQKTATDTPAIYADTGEWARTEGGELLFRPAGHGALLENLNAIDADVVFVKNIDNVVPDRLKGITVAYKELLGGILLHVRNQMFAHLKADDDVGIDLAGCRAFLSKWFDGDFSALEADELHAFMNRPLRVCGMVKNEGEPGGGPFFVADGEHASLQIVEKAQIDLADSAQEAIFGEATHFNPVDLVLSVKDHRGKAFDLKEFRNPDTGMVVEKTHLGRPIKALELPGLWNGAMHHWNTIFVEVPIETFNPVKTVFDLVRPNHL